MLFLRSLFFTILFPGTVTLLVPYWIVSRELAGLSGAWTWHHFAGLPVIALGAGVLLRCIWDFYATGRGTLAPVDPPTKLVVHGLYRYARNPMYLGVVLIVLGEAVFFRSPTLLVYSGIFFGIVHIFVVDYEEPTLRSKFGEPYDVYRRAVPRWVPRKPKK